MAAISNIKVLITGVDRLSNKLSVPMQKIRKMGKQMMGVGAAMSLAISTPITAAGLDILKTAGDFEYAMNKVQNLTEATGDQFEMLQNQAKHLGETTAFTASEAASGMGFLAMAGFEATEVFNAMPDALNLAAAAQMDLGETSDIVSNIMQGFNKDTKETQFVADTLVKTFQSSNTNLRQLGDAMSYVAPIAYGMNVDFKETATAIGMFSNAGIQGTRAGTSLRNALSRLAAPTGQAVNVLNRLGIPKDKLIDSEGGIISLRNVVEEFEKSGANATDMLQIFGQRAGPAMASMITQGVTAFDRLHQKIVDSGGAAQKAADVQLSGLNGALKELKSAVEGFKLAIAASGILEFVTDLAKRLTQVFRALNETNPTLLKMATIAAALVAVIGPLTFIIGALVVAFTFISAKVLLVVAAVVAVIAVFTVLFTYWKEITGWIENAWARTWGALPKPIQAAIKVIMFILNPFYQKLVLIMALFKMMKPIFGFIGKVGGAMFKGIGSGLKALGAPIGAEGVGRDFRTHTPSEFRGTLTIDGLNEKSRMEIAERGGLNIETYTGPLMPGVTY